MPARCPRRRRCQAEAACWFTPILARDGGLLGTFAMYHRAPLSDADLALAQVFAGTAAPAIERDP
ncbi:GAF domain-containing protein [Paractinoplanes brasiliensis]|uniref:GAF domain-containing protein n=1 Tax=Paractinoplanes brasiliensis TaxID=52695 RepID=UPI001EF257FF|nr:GAF domain-containing protein [Actinoplanes brasiliensis]